MAALKTFSALSSPVWSARRWRAASRTWLCLTTSTAKGKGLLAESFQQIVADEQRPTIVARAGLGVGGTVAVAWDGGKEASRAARTALPLLQRAGRVDPGRAGLVGALFRSRPVAAVLQLRGIKSEVQIVTELAIRPCSLKAAKGVEATPSVAGAFGHPRLQEYIFGGTTRAFLNATDGPSLFLSH